MFTTSTNVTAPAASTTAAALSSFRMMNTPNNHSLVTSSSNNPPWRLPSPAVVSIINSSSRAATLPVHGNLLYIAAPPSATNTILLQSPQTVRLLPPSLTVVNHSNATITGPVWPSSSTPNQQCQVGTCIDTPTLARLGSTATERVTSISLVTENCDRVKVEPEEPTRATHCSVEDDLDASNDQQDSEIELFVNNVVCTFALSCKLNLRKIAMEAANVIYKRDHAMVLMKIRNPYCSANLWSSGKVTVTGTTSEEDSQRAARRVARCLQRLGYKIKLRNYRVVNCLATCAMPWPIDIVKLSKIYSECVSYEPEIHPGATVRLTDKAVLKVFTTGRITLTAPSVERINTAVNEFYPQLFECRKTPQVQ